MSAFLKRILPIFLVMIAAGSPARAHVELHAHLFMKEAMTWAFRGGFFEDLSAKDWRDKFSSQANPESLNDSGLKIVVVSLYAHPFFTLSLRDSVRRQIDLAERFVKENPDWVIARSSEEARAAIAGDKRVLILGLEGAEGVLETEEDLKEFVDERGVRMVTLLHLTDDRFGGVAFLDGVRALANPVAWFKGLFGVKRSEGVRVNPQGLSEEGVSLAEALIRRGVWIDLAHASDESQKELLPLMEKAGQPPLYTHTVLRRHFGAERALADWQLETVSRRKGVIGLMPSQTMLKRTKVDPAFCPGGSCTEACEESDVRAFATHYAKIAARAGHGATVTGTDYNGGVLHFAPPEGCPTGTSLDGPSGFWNISQAAEVWTATRAVGAEVPDDKSELSVRTFLEAWGRVAPLPPQNKKGERS